MKLTFSLSFFLVTIFFSCSFKKENKKIVVSDKIISGKLLKDFSLDKSMVSSSDYNFFADSILHGYKNVLKYYFRKYVSDSCQRLNLKKENIIKNFEGLSGVGDINNNNIKDFVFVLEPLTFCKVKDECDCEGDAYYFTDTSLPRLQTNSYCCHPQNLFNLSDIDEDGISEIGLFFSSCASHYKSLYVYSLKKGSWKIVGHSVFDLYYMDTEKSLSSWIRKTGKNKFEMLQITDLTEKSKIGKRDWLKFVIK